MVAIEKNNQVLIDESLASLEQEAERTGVAPAIGAWRHRGAEPGAAG